MAYIVMAVGVCRYTMVRFFTAPPPASFVPVDELEVLWQLLELGDIELWPMYSWPTELWPCVLWQLLELGDIELWPKELWP